MTYLKIKKKSNWSVKKFLTAASKKTRMSLSEVLISLPLPQVVGLTILSFMTTKISGGLPALSLRKDRKTEKNKSKIYSEHYSLVNRNNRVIFFPLPHYMSKVWGNWEVRCTKRNCCSWSACQRNSVSIFSQSWKIAYSFQAILCALCRFSHCPMEHTDSTPRGRLHVITQEGAAMVTHTRIFFFLSFLFFCFLTSDSA